MLLVIPLRSHAGGESGPLKDARPAELRKPLVKGALCLGLAAGLGYQKKTSPGNISSLNGTLASSSPSAASPWGICYKKGMAM
jgi:hypothetical protein